MASFPPTAWILTVVGAALTGAAVSAAPLPREILGGELIIKDTLETLEAPLGRIQYLPDEEPGGWCSPVARIFSSALRRPW